MQPLASPESIESLEIVACPICRVDDCEVIYPSCRATFSPSGNEFRPSGDRPLEDPLVRCRRCGMQYVNPRFPSDLALQEYSSCVDESFVSQTAGRELTFKKNLALLQSIWRKSPGRLLDAGTANGSFLKVARDAGWEVAGCEPNRWLCRWCEEHYGISLTPGTLLDGRYPSGSFDLITLWDVLEHTPDPRGVLRECERLLAPGGLLAVNYPDIGSWIARTMGRRWVFLISVHYYYFTRETMTRLLRAVGFVPIFMKPHIQTLSLDYLLFRAQAQAGRAAWMLRHFSRRVGLGSTLIPYWMGQTLVCARRESEGLRHGSPR